MNGKNQDFSQEDLAQMLRRPEAQELLSRLRQLDSAALHNAVHQAMQGNTDSARQILTPMMQDPKIQSLAEQMRGGYGGI